MGQLAKVLNSRPFHNSTLLQAFLRFITEETVCGQSLGVSEYTIATRALGRGPDFDSASDTIVRTQAYRLRQKLHEYYTAEGANDELLIEVPKGHYVPAFRPNVGTDALSAVTSIAAIQTPAEVSKSNSLNALWRRAGILLTLICATAFGMLLERKISPRKPDTRKTDTSLSAGPVDSFWKSFLQSDKEPIIAYTNTLFLATERGDFYDFPGGPVGERGTRAGPEIISSLGKQLGAPMRGPFYFEDSFTGVGDVLASVSVSNALIHAGGQPSLKRGRLLTTYDLENHNVVFIGSPFVNQILNELPERVRFVFARKPSIWASGIEDIGLLHRYTPERSADSGMILADYAVISCLRGLKPGRRVLIVAGLTTSGTAAAARFASSADGIVEMSKHLHRPALTERTWPTQFEVLLRARLSHGLDVVRTDLVASYSAEIR